jgi:hypothetical protein
MDQQLWRVRHPKEVKVWISPRRASFDTSADVVRREIQHKQLFKSVLSEYDDNLIPEFHTDDEFIDMAVLARSQQLMSKNALKHNFIAMKRQHGHEIVLVDRDLSLSVDGRIIDATGKILADEEYRDQLMSAPVISVDEADDIDARVEAREDVTMTERLAFTRHRMERFYRAEVSDDMIAQDDRGRFRQKVRRFEQLSASNILNETNDRRRTQPAGEFALRLRFLTDWTESGRLLAELLSLAGVYNEGRFLVDHVYDRLTLVPMMRRAVAIKAVIEGQLEIELRRDESKGVEQLRELLKLIGLTQTSTGKTKAQAIAGGKTIYRYRLDQNSIARMTEITSRRASPGN